MPRHHSSPLQIAVSVVALFLLASCSSGGNDDPRVAVLEAKVAALQAQVSSLDPQLAALKRQADLNKMFRDWEGVAYLTPGSTGYAVVGMDLGKLTVSLANVAAYANGSKVTLQFGNLTSATIDGLKATVEWGPTDKDGTPNNVEAKSKEFSPTESLLPGAWNTTEIILEGVPPASLGFVRVREVSHRVLRMRGHSGV